MGKANKRGDLYTRLSNSTPWFGLAIIPIVVLVFVLPAELLIPVVGGLAGLLVVLTVFVQILKARHQARNKDRRGGA